MLGSQINVNDGCIQMLTQTSPDRRPIVFFDLETTGLCSRNDRIIEIAAIKFVAGHEHHSSMSQLIAIDRPVPRFITRLTGITDEMLSREGLPLESALDTFIDFIGDHSLVAFNINFDARFIKAAIERHGRRPLGNTALCALQAAREAWPELDSHKLINLARHLNLEQGTSHRALNDARLAAEVFFRAMSSDAQKPVIRQVTKSFAHESVSTIPIISGSRQFRIEVLGKDRFQDVYERVCGPRSDGGPALDIQAQLRLERNSSAVKVLIEEEVIGNLSPRIAQDFRRAIIAGDLGAFTHFECSAKIRGGRRTADGSTNPYEMWVDIPQDDD